jgi:hypothetical protein
MPNRRDTTDRLARVFTHEVRVGAMNRGRTNVRCNSISVDLVTARGEDEQRLTVRVEDERVAHLTNFDVQLLGGTSGGRGRFERFDYLGIDSESSERLANANTIRVGVFDLLPAH